jgi:peptidoglycan hydrolase-like protein with peptidoglycan-binding domain
VQDLQRLLGMSEHLHTGFFGSATDRDVREFQKASGLKVDGIVGPKTWGKLRR